MEYDFDKGQHFLVNKKVIQKEISLANLTGKDKVIEIGAGKGVLTREILKSGCKLLGFEIDKKFEKELEDIKKENKNFEIVYGDALKFSWRGSNKIVANIPYYLSEAIIMKAIVDGISEMVLIVGENFKNALLEDTKIGIIARIFFDIKAVQKLEKEDFEPSPRVDSWIMSFKRNEKGSVLLRSILLKKGKLKNAIVYSLVENGKTKKESKDILKLFKLNEQVLNKPVGKLTFKLVVKIAEDIKEFDLG